MNYGYWCAVTSYKEGDRVFWTDGSIRECAGYSTGDDPSYSVMWFDPTKTDKHGRLIMKSYNTVFLLYEHFTGTICGRDSTLLDIYTDFKKAEDARVGLNACKEHAWIEYELVEWEVRE